MDKKRAGENLAFPVKVYSQQGKSEDISLVFRKEKQSAYEELLRWLNRN
jgi:hypothetical protein